MNTATGMRLIVRMVKAMPYGLLLLMLAIHVPLLLRLVPPNLAYGVRTKATLNSEAVWYAVNQQTAMMGIIGAAVGLIAVYAYGRLASGGWKKKAITKMFIGVGVFMLFSLIRF